MKDWEQVCPNCNGTGMENFGITKKEWGTCMACDCPCCVGAASEARPAEWYHDRKLVRAVLDPDPKRAAKGAQIWQCVICKNKRQVTPA